MFLIGIVEAIMGKNENVPTEKAVEIFLKKFRQINSWISALKILSVTHILITKLNKSQMPFLLLLTKPSFPNLNFSKNDEKSYFYSFGFILS